MGRTKKQTTASKEPVVNLVKLEAICPSCSNQYMVICDEQIVDQIQYCPFCSEIISKDDDSESDHGDDDDDDELELFDNDSEE